MKYAPTLKLRVEAAIHYVAESMIAGNKRFISESTNKVVTLAATPAGALLYTWIRKKTKR